MSLWRDRTRVVLSCSWVASVPLHTILYNTTWSPPKAATEKIWKQYFWIVFFINKFGIQSLHFPKNQPAAGWRHSNIFQGMPCLIVNSLFDYFSGNATSNSKLIIRERTDSPRIRSLGDAKILFNFEWPYHRHTSDALVLAQVKQAKYHTQSRYLSHYGFI